MRAKRILWILNHKTLIKFEVPLLRELGYEVYIPKKPPFDISIDVDWESDKLLSVPQEDLDVLNGFDFYVDNMTPDVAAIINKYFDIAMFIHIPRTIESMVDWFKGMLVLRAYGRLECEGSYTDVIMSSLGLGYFKKIEALGSRFVFSESYKGLSNIECEFFRNHTLYMPIGMPDCKINDKWDDTEKKVLYICPKIIGAKYFEDKYHDFKKNFEKIPYDIGGAQIISIKNDPHVLGYLPQDKYDKLYPSHSCLYYDSTEPNHITYPPLEAVRCGLPLVFLAGGMLDKVGGKYLPGRCRNVEEAKKKIKRIISGDKHFANKLRASQSVLLKKFSFEYCSSYWKTAMKDIENHMNEKSVAFYGRKKKKLCVILPEGYTGGVLDYTIRILTALKNGIEASGDDVELVFSYLDLPIFKGKDYFKRIREMNIPIRPFTWKHVNNATALEMLKLMGINYKDVQPEYVLPYDGVNYFTDCDAILFTVDRVLHPVLTFQPYGLISHDYIQRLAPQIFTGGIDDTPFLELARNAKAVFTSTPVTKEHTIQYAGVEKKRVHIIPVPFDMEPMMEADCKKPDKVYFLWSTNLAEHKNHKVVLEALTSYYTMGGTLKCIVTGVNTNCLSPRVKDDDPRVVNNSYVRALKDTITNTRCLKNNIEFLGNLPKQQYMITLKNASFLLHPGRYDNGNGTAFDAAYLGVPTISSDYAPMRFYDDYFSLNMKFFDCKDPDDICRTLFYMQENCCDVKSKLPSRHDMEALMVSNPAVYNKMYGIIKNNLLGI